MQQKGNVWPKIALGILGCEAVGALGAIWTIPGVRDWYPTLIKPPWTPPNSAFGPVWIMLYALIGIAFGLVWAKSEDSRKKRAMVWFGAQLALSVAWSAVFFGMRSPGWAYGVIILLWLGVAATRWLFSKISAAAGWLLVPYFLWITFASALNFAILSINVLKPTVQKMDADPRNGPPNSKPGASLR